MIHLFLHGKTYYVRVSSVNEIKEQKCIMFRLKYTKRVRKGRYEFGVLRTMVSFMSSKQTNTSDLLIRGGQMEWVKPNLRMSSWSDVRRQDERLGTVSFESKGSTTFRVSIASFFVWVLMICIASFFVWVLMIRHFLSSVECGRMIWSSDNMSEFLA